MLNNFTIINILFLLISIVFFTSSSYAKARQSIYALYIHLTGLFSILSLVLYKSLKNHDISISFVQRMDT